MSCFRLSWSMFGTRTVIYHSQQMIRNRQPYACHQRCMNGVSQLLSTVQNESTAHQRKKKLRFCDTVRSTPRNVAATTQCARQHDLCSTKRIRSFGMKAKQTWCRRKLIHCVINQSVWISGLVRVFVINQSVWGCARCTTIFEHVRIKIVPED